MPDLIEDGMSNNTDSVHKQSSNIVDKKDEMMIEDNAQEEDEVIINVS